ncbi:MAG: RNA-binding protein [Granulosicoccaceae bacterium]
MKLIARNLDRSTTEEELSELFQEYGGVQSCDLVIDQASGVSKGFGFVVMPKVGEAKAAMKSLNNMTIGNNKIRVKKAEEPKEPKAP